ncbi:MAG: alpha-ketoacid dehydrogenase subunit beta [Candidatus Omnitrophota bacterium]
MPWTKILLERLAPGPEIETGRPGDRKMAYSEAIREAFDQALANDPRVFLMGQGVDDPTGMFGTTLGLQKRYGEARVFDTPLAENGLTGVALGAALGGMRPVYLHNRPDFLLLAMDQIVNHASKWSYMFGGAVKVPLVIWTVIGRGWGSAAQHSQALQGLFMHVPGLKLVMPATPYDAKGLLITAIADNNPVIIIEHRWNFKQQGYVPKELYSVPFGKGAIRREGKDLTIVAASYMVSEAIKASDTLFREDKIDAEVLDLRTLKPLDEEMILRSVGKTGRLLVADTGWKTGGITAEIAAIVAEKGFSSLRSPVKRVASEDVPTPSSYVLEDAFYKGAGDIVRAAKELFI